MTILRHILCAVALGFAVPVLAEGAVTGIAAAASAGPFASTVRDETWEDTRRGRSISVRLYVPTRDTPAPVVIFSHGLGGSREAAPYLGTHWASHGFLAVFVQHPGSDREVWAGKTDGSARELLIAAANPQNAVARFRDLPFVIDELERRRQAGPIKADTGRIAMAGHSFGSHSVLAAAGRAYPTAMGTMSFKDKRIRAAIALSPAAPPAGLAGSELQAIYEPIDIPILHITGTKDGDPLRNTNDWEQRIVAFRKITGPPQLLAVFDDADHMVFAGRDGQGPKAVPNWYPNVQQDVQTLSTLFLKAWLEDDIRARAALAGSAKQLGLHHPLKLESKDWAGPGGR